MSELILLKSEEKQPEKPEQSIPYEIHEIRDLRMQIND